MSIALLLPLMMAPAIASLMWKLMTNPDFGVLSYLVGLIGLHRLQMGLGAVDRAVHGRAGRRLGLHALHHDPAARRPALACRRQPFEAAELDGVPRSFVFFRITLPMLMPYIITATLFRMLDSIQQFDIIYAMTQGGPGDSAAGVPGPGLSRVLPVHQCRPLGGADDGAVGDRLLPRPTFIKQWLRLRERARGVLGRSG